MPSFAQTTVIRGDVFQKDSGSPIGNAVVTVRNDKGIIRYSTTTSLKGSFSLEVKNEVLEKSLLVVSCMGYKSDTSRIANKKYFKIDLQTKAFVIKDVYVAAPKVLHRNDTTRYLVSAFTNTNDRTIGDVLRKMPGIAVSSNGTVSYNGTAVDGFMIEGLDAFDGQYNIATRNISHSLVSSVDVIENYHSEKVMKESKKEGGTVLNLNLKDKAKGHWSGSVRAALGAPKLWEGELFGACLSGDRQTAVTAKSNNSGKDIVSENRVLTIDEYLNDRQKDQAKPLLSVQQSRPGVVDDQRSNDGRTHIVNVVKVKKLSSSAVLNTKVYYSDERNTANTESNTSYFLSDSVLSKQANEHSILNRREFGTTIQYKKDGEKSFFLDKLQYTGLWQRNLTQVKGDYNEVSKIHSDEHTIDNTLRWIKPIARHRLSFLSRTKYIIVPEDVEISSTERNKQTINRSQFYSSNKFNFTYSFKHFEIDSDAEGIVSVSNMRSNLVLNSLDSVPNEDNEYNFLAFSVRPRLSYKNKGLRIELTVPLSAFHYFGLLTDNKFYCRPTFTYSQQLNSMWKLRASVILGKSAPTVSNAHEASVMTDYKTFRSSPLSVYGNVHNAFLIGLNYTNYAKMLFTNASVSKYWDKDNQMTTKRIVGGRVYYSTTDGSNKRRGLMAMGNISKHFSTIKTTLNLRCLYAHGSSGMYQNNSAVNFQTDRLQTTVGLNSRLCDWLETDYNLDYNVNTLNCYTAKSTTKLLTQKLSAVFSLLKNLNLTVIAEHYVNSSTMSTTQHNIFGDVKCTYRYQKIDFSMSINNIFNQKYYYTSTFNDLSSSYAKYALRSRNAMLGAVAYF